MNRILRNTIITIFLILCFHPKIIAEDIGQISGRFILDDSWKRTIYVSHISVFEKRYAVSNDLIIASASIDSLGNFKINSDAIPTSWSLLRLHIVKKGITPNSLVIGSIDENYMFLIANRDSKIKLYNNEGKPLFKNVKIEGADYMEAFRHVNNLSEYPNTIDYDNSLIEREFIESAVFEKLKVIADTCKNPLVSLYALSQTNFQADFYKDQSFYENYLSKWENQNNSYFESFRLNFPEKKPITSSPNGTKYLLSSIITIVILLITYYVYKRRGSRIKKLSVKEREIFDLLRKGMTNKEISSECNIELTTVKSHVSNIYSKLRIKSRKEVMDLKVR